MRLRCGARRRETFRAASHEAFVSLVSSLRHQQISPASRVLRREQVLLHLKVALWPLGAGAGQRHSSESDGILIYLNVAFFMVYNPQRKAAT